jgi:hypothetical protein
VTIAPAGGECGEGGTKFSNASGKGFVCNGEEGNPGAPGSPWTAGGTLPSGSTETGTWGAYIELAGKETAHALSPISFTIPLKEKISEWYYVTTVEQEKGEQPAQCEGEPKKGEKVKGTLEDPQAAKGNLCLYQGETREPAVTTQLKIGTVIIPATSGALVYVQYRGTEASTETAVLAGSWAVTAP